MAVLIDGKVISTKIKEELKQEVTEMKAPAGSGPA